MKYTRARGSTLLEVTLSIVLLGVIASYAIRTQREASLAQLDGLAGQHLKLIQLGLQNYLDTYRSELLKGNAVAGVALPLQPRMTELRAIGAMGSSVNDKGPTGLTYTLRVDRLPTGCVAGSTCTDLQGLAWSSTFLAPDGNPQRDRLALTALQMGIDAALPGITNSAVIVGQDGTWPVANPAAGNPAAIVVMRAGFGSGLNQSALLPRDGSRPMVGDLDMNGNAIKNLASLSTTSITNSGALSTGSLTTAAGTVTTLTSTTANVGTLNSATINNSGTTNTANLVASGTVTAANGLSTSCATLFAAADPNAIRMCGNQMFVRGSTGALASFDAGDVVATSNVSGKRLALRETVTEGAACSSTSGALASGTTEVAALASGGVATCSGGVWTAAGRSGTVGGACTQPGSLATDPFSGTALFCRNGQWVKLSAFTSSFVLVGTYEVSDGSSVSKPSCQASGGSASPQSLIVLIPGNEGPPTDGTNLLGINRYSVDVGASWTVHLETGATGRTLAGTELAHVYCYYP